MWPLHVNEYCLLLLCVCCVCVFVYYHKRMLRRAVVENRVLPLYFVAFALFALRFSVCVCIPSQEEMRAFVLFLHFPGHRFSAAHTAFSKVSRVGIIPREGVVVFQEACLCCRGPRIRSAFFFVTEYDTTRIIFLITKTSSAVKFQAGSFFLFFVYFV